MWPFTRKVEDYLFETKRVKIKRMIFLVKKIDPFDYLDGSRAVLKIYDTYKTGKEHDLEIGKKKIRDHYRNILLAGIVEPKLARTKEEPGLFVDHIFADLELTEQLIEAIYEFTYGKKKLKQLLSRVPAQLISTP